MKNVTVEQYDAPASFKRQITYEEKIETSYWLRFKCACLVFWKVMFLDRKDAGELTGAPVHVKAESVALKSAVAFGLYIKAEQIEKFRAAAQAQVPPPEHYCDVKIDIDGRKAEMTWDEFTRRLFMELPA